MSESSARRLTEDEIRPDAMMNELNELFTADIARLMQGRDHFVRVCCPACGLDEGTHRYEKLGQHFELCPSCHTVYANPRPTPEQLNEHYMTATYYKYWNEVVFPATEDVRRDKIVRERVRRVVDFVRRQGTTAGTLVEVGAGFGTFCEEIARQGVFSRVLAVEPTPGLAESCRKRGVEVFEGPVERFSFESEMADIVVSFEVIEHLFAPAEFLEACSRLLGPGGFLVLTCPNVKGFDVVTMGALSSVIDPEHLNYFTPESLALLVQGHGFDVTDASTPGKLDAELVRKKVLAGELSLDDCPFLEQVLIERWDGVGDAFQAFLADNGLSSHLWLVAQKTR